MKIFFQTKVKMWLDVRKITKRGPGPFKVNGGLCLLEDLNNLQKANDQINTMMQQTDQSRNEH